MLEGIVNSLKPASYKEVPFMVMADDRVEYSLGNKIVEHRYIGDYNLNEIIGRDIEYYQVKMYLSPAPASTSKTQESTNELALSDMLQALFRDQEEGVLILPDYKAVYATAIDRSPVIKYRGWYTIDVKFSNAPTSFKPRKPLIISTLEETRTAANNLWARLVSFQNAAYQAIQTVTTAVNRIANTINGIAANFSAFTTFLNTFATTGSILTGSLINLANSITEMRNNLINLPNNLLNFVNSFSNVIDAFRGIFATPEAAIDGLLNLGTDGVQEMIPTNTSGAALESANNNALFIALIQTEVLINVYDLITQIQTTTVDQLNKVIEREQQIYNSVVENGGLTDELVNMRNQYFLNIQELLANAIQIQDVEINLPMNLRSLVYRYNGNQDYLEETRILNKITNTFAVQGNIRILLNNAS